MSIESKLVDCHLTMSLLTSKVARFGSNVNQPVSLSEITFKDTVYYIVHNGSGQKIEVILNGKSRLMNSIYTVLTERPTSYKEIHIGNLQRQNLGNLDSTAFITYTEKQFIEVDKHLLSEHFDFSDKSILLPDDASDRIFKIKLHLDFHEFCTMRQANKERVTIDFISPTSYISQLKLLSADYMEGYPDHVFCNNIAHAMEVLNKVNDRIKMLVHNREQKELNRVPEEVKELRKKILSHHQSNIDKIKDVSELSAIFDSLTESS